MVAARRRGLAGLPLSLVLAVAVRGAVAFETDWLSIQIDDTGVVRGLLERASGVDYGVPQQPAPLLALCLGGQFQTPKTAIKKIVGETVGVVHNDRFAPGIQALNVKTLGGCPTAENDVMPGRGAEIGWGMKDRIEGGPQHQRSCLEN